MATILAFHEVDDVEHWLRSPKRQEIFGPLGITGRLFTDPAKTSRVGLVVDALTPNTRIWTATTVVTELDTAPAPIGGYRTRAVPLM